jgi:hypothetical protein
VTNISPSFGLEFTGLPSGLSFTSISLVKTVVVKMTLILAPGEYDLNGQPLIVDDNLVNIISLTGNTDVKLTGLSSFVAAMRIIANNILVKGIEAASSYIQIGDGLNNLVVENCKGGTFSFSTFFLAVTYLEHLLTASVDQTALVVLLVILAELLLIAK